MRIRLDQFTKTFGPATVIDRLDLEIQDGEMMALLGPSGCGKSTTLFAICGIHRVNGGRILFGERDVSNVPSQKRNVGIVFQSYALYPHMTVFDNIAFPLMIRKEPASDIKRKVRAMTALVHIDELLDRRPSQLSGGQQQRVALARALVREPDVLLLDEPLANLDAKLRLEMRSEIRRIQRETGITAVLVTHDQVEAMSMCDRIAIMNQGTIVQVAEPMEMYADPASAFVAGFLGNPPIAFLDGNLADGRFILAGTDIAVEVPADWKGKALDKMVKLGVRPEFFQPDVGTPLPGRVTFIEPQGRETLYDIALPNGAVLRSIQRSTNRVALGDEVPWGIDMEKALLFDEAGARL
ncbi:MAG: ABC transporter ATP-binding protein [Geminicoccales bacterium]